MDGIVRQIKTLKGNLNFLRPWLYPRERVSEPAFKNERVIIEIEDKKGQSWWLALVGGMGVGTIQLASMMQTGTFVLEGDVIGGFLLGSTCCLIVPFEVLNLKYLQAVDIGESLVNHTTIEPKSETELHCI